MNDREANWREHRRSIYLRPDPKLYLRPDPKLYLRHDAHRFLPPQVNDSKYGHNQRHVPVGSAGDAQRQSGGEGALDVSTLLSHKSKLAEIECDLAKFKSELAWMRFQRAFFRYVQVRLKAGFNPVQPRVSAGNPDGGQWTHEGSEITDSRVLSDATPDPIAPGAQFAADGHHYVPRGVFENEKYSLRPETMQVFENEKTGSLNDPTSNWYDEPHRQYNKAVEEALDRYLERNKIRSDQMTPDQARSFAQEVKTSRDPRIRQFNMRIWMREIMFQIRRGFRGRE